MCLANEAAMTKRDARARAQCVTHGVSSVAHARLRSRVRSRGSGRRYAKERGHSHVAVCSPRRHARHARCSCLDDLQQAAADDDKEEEACVEAAFSHCQGVAVAKHASHLGASAAAQARVRRSATHVVLHSTCRSATVGGVKRPAPSARTEHKRPDGEGALGPRRALRHVAAAQNVAVILVRLHACGGRAALRRSTRMGVMRSSGGRCIAACFAR